MLGVSPVVQAGDAEAMTIWPLRRTAQRQHTHSPTFPSAQRVVMGACVSSFCVVHGGLATSRAPKDEANANSLG